MTVGVGVVQGITALCFFRRRGKLDYGIAFGFTAFSLCSAAFKLFGKISLFTCAKAVIYTAILVILLLPSSRSLFKKK